LDFALHSQEWKRRQHHNYFVTTSDAAEILQVPELCWVFSLIFVRNNSSFSDEGGGALAACHHRVWTQPVFIWNESN